MFLRGQATLYTVGLWLYGQNMLDFHFIDTNHVTNPVYQVIIVKSRPQSI